MLRASPHLSHFVPLPPRSRAKRTRRKKRDVHVANPIVYREAKLATAMSKSMNRLGKGERGKDGSTEERCRINTRPSTETRCYSRYAERPRTISVIRERERIQTEDRRSAERAVETCKEKDKEPRRRGRKVLHQDGTR
ncbi:hypothetical protein ALC56_09431 [Trachymyrmex septentrionalis]|uniref:Uncharacterized protein n=1 Tax=Trachymyrmex septentrionalis TaxID=34720 RepID=A0A195F788_9HYME|nr:hypothetical protein ALC56_09431 [Trachymyrmex septentrionalis]